MHIGYYRYSRIIDDVKIIQYFDSRSDNLNYQAVRVRAVVPEDKYLGDKTMNAIRAYVIIRSNNIPNDIDIVLYQHFTSFFIFSNKKTYNLLHLLYSISVNKTLQKQEIVCHAYFIIETTLLASFFGTLEIISRMPQYQLQKTCSCWSFPCWLWNLSVPSASHGSTLFQGLRASR